MKIIIDNMMWSNISVEKLEAEKELEIDIGQTLYWDYYLYVKDNHIDRWNKETHILYGNKDNMQEEKVVREFVHKYNCNLDILENAEHFFHTEEQLNYYKGWINRKIIWLADRVIN